MYHPFRQFISDYTDLTQEDWEKIENCIVREAIKKDTLILEEGNICQYLYFLESGLLRFFIWKEGNDITKYFTEIPYTFTSQKSFTSRQPAKESIEALEDCIIWKMSYQDAHILLENKAWNIFIRKLVQEVQIFTEEILEEMQTQTAETRYKMMLENNPAFLQRISLKHLASFLGIAPQSLSRIRKNIMPSNRT